MTSKRQQAEWVRCKNCNNSGIFSNLSCATLTHPSVLFNFYRKLNSAMRRQNLLKIKGITQFRIVILFCLFEQFELLLQRFRSRSELSDVYIVFTLRTTSVAASSSFQQKFLSAPIKFKEIRSFQSDFIRWSIIYGKI